MYLYCGMFIASNIIIPELPSVNQNKPGILFSLENAQPQLNNYIWSYHWLTQEGEPAISYREQNGYHWLRFPGIADFCISANAREISCIPQPNLPLETTRHLLLDQVLPRCLAHQGRIMVHASAVQLERGSLVFFGDSGAGKSTLAGNFYQDGTPVISDDCVWIKEEDAAIKAVPNYGGLRLWKDSLEKLFVVEQIVHPMVHYSTKKRVLLEKKSQFKFSKGIPILALILLSPYGQVRDREISLVPLSIREAFVEIAKKTFRLYLSDPKIINQHMQALGRIAVKLPAYRLSIPRDYALLPLVRRKILETVL